MASRGINKVILLDILGRIQRFVIFPMAEPWRPDPGHQ